MTETQRLERIAQRLERASELALARGSVTHSAHYLAGVAAVGTLQRSAARGEEGWADSLPRVSMMLDRLTCLAPEDSEEQRLADAASLTVSGLEEEL